MAVVKNTFSGTLDSVTTQTYTINGLTSETSTLSASYMSPEISSHFLKSLYQTLIDAGYSDASMNEEDYSITVLGFKFFCICRKGGSSTSYSFTPCIYTYGVSTMLNQDFTTSSGYDLTVDSSYLKVEYNITIRGDKNCLYIYFGSYSYPNTTTPLIFIAKAKNIIEDKDAYFWCGQLDTSSVNYTYLCMFYRNADNLYTIYSHLGNQGGYGCKAALSTCYNETGLQTSSKMVVEPVLGYYGTFLIYSMIMCNDNIFVKGNYYKIGFDIYYCNGYKIGSSSLYSGQYALFKVSD